MAKKDRIVKAYLDKCNAMLKAKDKSLSESERAQFAQESAPNGDVPVAKPYPDDLKQRSAKLGLALYSHLGIERHDFAARNAHTRRNFEAFGAPVIGFVLARRDFMPLLQWMQVLCYKRCFLLLKI